MIISGAYEYGIKLEPSDQYQASDRLSRLCVEATDAQLDEQLYMMGADPSEMTTDGKRIVVASLMNEFMVQTLEYPLLDWQLDNTIYEYQIVEFKKIYLAGLDYVSLSGEYFYWAGQYESTRAGAETVATSLGYSYMVSGDLMEKSFGSHSGIVAGLGNAKNKIVLSGSYPTSGVELKARVACVVKEAVTAHVESSPFSQAYSLNMDSYPDRPLMPYNVLSMFDWNINSIYDYVLFLSETGAMVNLSSLTASELSLYLRNGDVMKLKTADTMIKQRESLHNKTWAYSRKLDAIYEKLGKYKQYILMLRGIQ